MSNQWLRLWHDMPNDPKWKTISKISKQPISLVMAVYVHILVDASQCVTERGVTHVTQEDLASALDVEIDQISTIICAMQSRVLDGDRLKGWKERQPSREDSSTNRTQKYRERKNVTQCDAEERNVTLDKDKESILLSSIDLDKDTDTESIYTQKKKLVRFVPPTCEEVRLYFLEIECTDYDGYLDHYTSNGWLVGVSKAKMKDWKSAARNWKRTGNKFKPNGNNYNSPAYNKTVGIPYTLQDAADESRMRRERNEAKRQILDR